MAITPAKLWANNRNFAKFRLEGMSSSIVTLTTGRDCALTNVEIGLLDEARKSIEVVLEYWKDRTAASKKMYVKGT